MGLTETFVNFLFVVIGFTFMLLYPLYASTREMEGSSSRDHQQWHTYWILYSFLNLFELYCSSITSWIPLWRYIKLAFCMWLVLPRFNGATYLYESFAVQIESKERSKYHSNEKENEEKEEREKERERDHFKEEEDEEKKIFKAWKLVEDYIDQNGSDSLERLISDALKAEQARTG